MSIDLSRPLVNSTGQHDALDGLITCLQLQYTHGLRDDGKLDLSPAIDELTQMCAGKNWITDDPLGMGGLLDAVSRVAQLVFKYKVSAGNLLRQTMVDAEASLQQLRHRPFFIQSADCRLAFRELGLAIGLHGLQRTDELMQRDQDLAVACRDLCAYLPLAEQIERFWSLPEHRAVSTWLEHRDINDVMLATSLMPESYLAI
jgi:hypothetical protein